MSRKFSYTGQLPTGLQDRIKLSTITGKTGYKIVNFEILPNTMAAASEIVCKIFNTDQTGSIGPTVNFTDNNLLAVAYYSSTGGIFRGKTIIFDNEKFNQDIFVTMDDAGGHTIPGNYYIELESMGLNDIESTMMTLQSIRNITE